jgi:hypothetical protein
MTFSLPEDVYPIEFAPTKNQANSNGEVMFYAEGYGWYSGQFSRPHMPGTTHWTLLPDLPPTTLSNEARCEASYQTWAARQDLTPLGKEYLLPAYKAGWSDRVTNANR